MGRRLFPPFRFRLFPLFQCFILLAFLVSSHTRADSLNLTTSTDIATAGFFQLDWSWSSAPENVSYQLAERPLALNGSPTSFKTIYQGQDLASVISGKPDGRYEYKVTANSPSLSAPVTSNLVNVSVKHHSLVNAFAVLLVGVVIFLAIVIAIFRGAKTSD